MLKPSLPTALLAGYPGLASAPDPLGLKAFAEAHGKAGCSRGRKGLAAAAGPEMSHGKSQPGREANPWERQESRPEYLLLLPDPASCAASPRPVLKVTGARKAPFVEILKKGLSDCYTSESQGSCGLQVLCRVALDLSSFASHPFHLTPSLS